MFYSGDDAEPSSGQLEVLCHDGFNESVPDFHFENTTNLEMKEHDIRQVLSIVHFMESMIFITFVTFGNEAHMAFCQL